MCPLFKTLEIEVRYLQESRERGKEDVYALLTMMPITDEIDAYPNTLDLFRSNGTSDNL
jgi:hypothetical protein